MRVEFSNLIKGKISSFIRMQDNGWYTSLWIDNGRIHKRTHAFTSPNETLGLIATYFSFFLEEGEENEVLPNFDVVNRV